MEPNKLDSEIVLEPIPPPRDGTPNEGTSDHEE